MNAYELACIRFERATLDYPRAKREAAGIWPRPKTNTTRQTRARAVRNPARDPASGVPAGVSRALAAGRSTGEALPCCWPHPARAHPGGDVMTLLNASDLDTSPVEFLTAGIPRIGHGFLYGPSTAGKSLVALDLALAVANPGAKWCGHEVNYHGTVAYLMGEGVSSMGVRVKARLAREQSDQTAAVAAEQRDHGDQAARAMIAALPRSMTRPTSRSGPKVSRCTSTGPNGPPRA